MNLLLELENKTPNTAGLKELSEILLKNLQENEEDLETLKNLGHIYLAKGNDKKAHEYYQKALLSKGLDDPELWYGIGTMYYKNGNFTYAEPAFLRVLSLNQDFSKSSSVKLKLGLIYKRCSLYQEAIQYFEKCEGEDLHSALIQKAFCMIKLGKKTEALDLIKQAHQMAKTPYSALCLGWVISSSDLEQSLIYLNEGLALCQKDTVEELDLIYAIAQVMYKKKDCSEAFNYYTRLINKNSGDFNVWNSFGILCAETGQSSQAFRCFIRASELSQSTAEIWNNIGTLYWRSGQLNESKLAFEKAVRYSEKPDQVKEATKEYIHCDWNLSELPHIKRPAITKGKFDLKEPEQRVTGFVSAPTAAGYTQNYAAMMGYFNYFRQIANSRITQVKNEDDKAAQILTDLSQMLPSKRDRDNS